MKNNLKKKKKKHNMTQADVLAKTKIAMATISGIETGRRDIKDITLETALRFAKCFNCTVEDLVKIDEE